MIRFFFALIVLSGSLFAQEWKDGNGVTWTPLSIRSSYESQAKRCHQLGKFLPRSGDLLDAIEFGLFQNPAFGKEISSFDWMWVRDPGTLGAQWMVSKQGDSSPDEGTEPHFAICASR